MLVLAYLPIYGFTLEQAEELLDADLPELQRRARPATDG